MDIELALEYATAALIALCIAVPLLIWRKGLLREFLLPAALLCAQELDSVIRVSILYFRKPLGIERMTATHIFFWGTWSSFVLEGILRIAIIYSVFHLYMRPLEGLQRIGKIVFRWVAAVSVLVSLGFAMGGHITGSGTGGTATFVHIASQAQQGISILTLCLLLFVCFATKPLGLTYRSQLFGVTLGLGILAMTDLVQAAWTSTGTNSPYSGVYLFSTLGAFSAFLVWGTYFALPEPKRRFITLPTTSPFFFWNRISEVLGDNPGEVVVAGFRPDMLSDAEIAMFSAPDKPTIIREPVETQRIPQLQSAAY